MFHNGTNEIYACAAADVWPFVLVALNVLTRQIPLDTGSPADGVFRAYRTRQNMYFPERFALSPPADVFLHSARRSRVSKYAF